jgi:hypothetical protein
MAEERRFDVLADEENVDLTNGIGIQIRHCSLAFSASVHSSVKLHSSVCL